MKNRILIFCLLGALVLLLFFADIIWGSVSLPVGDVIKSLFSSSPDSITDHIVRSFRLPKACTALLAGMALSVCGLQMQTIFRNPLADPYVLGISSGAGLGVALFILGTGSLSLSSLPFFADMGMATAGLIGAMVVTIIIMAASQRLRNTLSLLVLGVMIGSVGSALIGLMQYIAPASSLKMYVLWTMGSFSGVSGSRLAILAALCFAGLIIAIANIKNLNAMLMGDSYARSLGINVRKVRNSIFLSVALLAGSVTAFCGPIGFIGIAVPHICRMSLRDARHQILIPGCCLAGAAIMLLADFISQAPWSGTVIPINTLAALMGVPVIIYIIIRQKV